MSAAPALSSVGSPLLLAQQMAAPVAAPTAIGAMQSTAVHAVQRNALVPAPWLAPGALQGAPNTAALLQGGRVLPQVLSKPPGAQGLDVLESALPPRASLEQYLKNMTPAQRQVVGNVALLLLAEHRGGRLNGADFRAALEKLLQRGAGIEVGARSGALAGQRPRAASNALAPPLQQPLPAQRPLAIPAPLRPAAPTRSAETPRPGELDPKIAEALVRLAHRFQANNLRWWDPNDPDPMQRLLEQIAQASPHELERLLTVLRIDEPELFKWLLTQTEFVNALAQRMNVDVAAVAEAIGHNGRFEHDLRMALANHLPLAEDSSTLGALLVTLASARPDDLQLLRQSLIDHAPALQRWLVQQRWFGNAVQERVADGGSSMPPDLRAPMYRQSVLLESDGNGRTQPLGALPAYEVGSDLYFMVTNDPQQGHRVYVVPGPEARIGKHLAPRGLSPADVPNAGRILRSLAAGRPQIERAQVFSAVVLEDGRLMVGSAARQLDRWALQSTADATMRPVQTASALAVPRRWTMALERIGFTHTQVGAEIRTAPDQPTWQESTVLRLCRQGGVDRVLPMLEAVTAYRRTGVIQGEDLGHCIKFMRLMYRESTAQARLDAQQLLLREWRLLPQRDAPSQSQARAQGLLEKIVAHIESMGDAPQQNSNWIQLRDQLQFRYGAVWMDDALRTLREHAGTDAFGTIAQRYLLKLIETSTELRPSSGGMRP